jgi:hypothetical protein
VSIRRGLQARLRGLVSKRRFYLRLGPFRALGQGQNPNAPAVKREADCC